MLFEFVLVGLLSLGGSSVQAETTFSDLVAKAPKCALSCVLDNVKEANCPLTNVTLLSECVCTNVTVLSNLSTCVQLSCPFSDQVQARNVEADLLCKPYQKPSRINEVRAATIAALAVTLPIVVARCFARWSVAKTLFWDDYTALIATVFLIGLCGIELASAQLGFGMHYWDVDPQNGTTLLQLFWAVQMFYILIQVFAKVSIVIMYARVFPTRWFQITIKIFITFIFLHGSIFLLCIMFQCLPIPSIWDRSLNKKCLNVTAIGWAGGAFSIAEDLFILVLPIPELWKLQFGWQKKLGLILMFSFGSFATITSVIRMRYLVMFSTTYDTTWDNVDIVIWSIIEELSAVACACLPPCRPLLNQWIPTLFSTIKKSSFNSSQSRSRRVSFGARRLSECLKISGKGDTEGFFKQLPPTPREVKFTSPRSKFWGYRSTQAPQAIERTVETKIHRPPKDVEMCKMEKVESTDQLRQ